MTYYIFNSSLITTLTRLILVNTRESMAKWALTLQSWVANYLSGFIDKLDHWLPSSV